MGASRPTQILIGVALAVAFSPVLVDLALEYAQSPAARFGLVAALGLGLATVFDDGEGVRQSRWGTLALLVGLGLVLLGVAARTSLLGRGGLAIAAVGLAALRGRPSLRATGLVFAAVPVPVTVLGWASPGWETAVAVVATSPLRALGIDTVATGGVLESAGSGMQLLAIDAGLPLAIAAGALAWLSADWRGVPLLRACVEVLAAGVAAVSLQFVLVAVAALLLGATGPGLARDWLDTAGFALALAVLAWLALRQRRAHFA